MPQTSPDGQLKQVIVRSILESVKLEVNILKKKQSHLTITNCKDDEELVRFPHMTKDF